MAYNSMSAMLMGGILPGEITDEIVDAYMRKKFRRPKTFVFGETNAVGDNWYQIIKHFAPIETDVIYGDIVNAIGTFLRVSAQYGLVDGPRSLQALRAARIKLINLGRPFVDIAIRVMKELRRSRDKRSKTLRKQFLEERDPLEALRFMQFAPGFSYYKNQITPLPKSLAERLRAYQTDDTRRMAATIRAAKRAAKIKGLHYGDYGTKLDVIDPLSLPTREKGDFAYLRPPPDPKYLPIVEAARATRLATINELYPTLAEKYRF